MYLKILVWAFWGLVFGPLSNEMEHKKQVDPIAKEILDATRNNFNKIEGVEASFKLTVEQPESDIFYQVGDILLKGDMYKISLPDQEIICDNKSVWRYLKDINEVQITDYEPEDNEITPSKLFTVYNDDFESLYTHDEVFNKKKCHVVDLKPIDGDRSYFKVRTWIDANNKVIRGLKVFDRNGSRYLYEINTYTPKKDINNSIFSFDEEAFPDVTIEDLRF